MRKWSLRGWTVLALCLVVGLFAASPAMAQLFPPIGGGGTEEKSDKPLVEALQESVGEGAEIIVIRPSGGGASADPQPEQQGGGGSDWNYGAQFAPEGAMVEMARSELDKLFLIITDRIRRADALRAQTVREYTAKSPSGDSPDYFQRVVLHSIGWLLLSSLAVLLIVGVGLIRPWFLRMKRPNPQTIDDKLPILLLRAALGVMGVALAALVAAALGLIFGWQHDHEATQSTVLIVFVAFIAIRLTAIGWRVILAPFLSEYRIPKLTDREAFRLFVWLFGTGALAIAFQAYCVWLSALELPIGYHALVSSGLTGVIVLLVIMFVLVEGRTVSRAIRGGKSVEEATWLSRWGGILWGPAAILYALVAWAVMTAQLMRGQDTGLPLIVSAYAILLAACGVYGLASFAISKLLGAAAQRRMAAQGAQSAFVAPGAAAVEGQIGGPVPVSPDHLGEAPLEIQAPPAGRMRNGRDLGRRIASIMAVGAGIYAFSRIWVDETSMAASAPWVDRMVDIIVIVLIGYICYHALRIWIDQKIEEEGGADEPTEPGEGEGGAGASRLATLLPLFRNFVLATITITVLLIVALELGINVGPLFAGAGIIGLAVGFGAQALVRDILSGAFFLIDDAFRKGEYVDIGSVKGTVERISVRSFQLRHHLGYLHTVPFGEIQSLTNYSRDWVVMKLPLRLTYDTDAEMVRKKIKKLGEELLEDPVHGSKFLQPLKSQGVIQMEDSAMIMRVKFMTKPGDQWVLRKVIFARIRDLFEREGIKFAHREVTVRVAGAADDANGELSPQQQKAIAGAASPTLLAHQQNEFQEDLGGGD